MSARLALLVLAVAGHLASTTAFAYLLGFLADRGVPRTVDRGGPAARWELALAIDLALVALFAAPHSLLARPAVKRRLAAVVPPAAERSVYAVIAALTLALVFWQWRPVPRAVWDATGRPWLAGVAWAGFGAGWAVCAVSVVATNLFELTGLRQGWLAARGRPHTPVPLKTSLLYAAVRHPLYVGFLLALWCTPRLTVGHLLFAAANTAYILWAVRYEERDLLAAHGPAYADYQARVPRLAPRLRGRPRRPHG